MKEAFSAVILASGSGSRLGRLTKSTPKPMLEFGGKPYIGHLIDWLLESSVDDIIVTTATHPTQIEKFINDNYDDRVRTVREPSLVSTVQSSEYGLREVNHETSLILTADNIWCVSIDSLIAKHREQDALATAMVTANPDVPNAGKVRVDQHSDTIMQMWPSDQSAEINVPTRSASTMGLYVVDRTALLDSIRPTDTSVERESMNRLTPNVAAYWNEDFFFDYGTPANYEYLKANPDIIAQNLQHSLMANR